MAPVKILPDQDYLKESLDYDPDTGVLTWKRRPASHFRRPNIQPRWNTKFAGTRAGYVSKDTPPRMTIGLDHEQYVFGRIVWKWMKGYDPIEVDHEDHDPTNHKWRNLREATRQQNCHNRWGGNKTGLPKGVSVKKNGFTATIFVNGHLQYLGHHPTPEAAHAAYCEAAIRFFGEFANFGH